MSNRYRDILIAGQPAKKHVRDIAKDEAILSLLPQGEKLAIFESSAGSAELARELAHQGHAVVISNYNIQGVLGVVEVQADLNRELPLDSGVFDIVLCREVIEHVESVPHVLREFRRLLKPGGTLIMTFPNRLQIRSRLYHLLTGFYRGMKSPINLDVPFGEAHINLLGYPEMDYFLRKTGYSVTGVTSSYFSASDAPWMLLRPLVRAATRYALLRHKPHAEEHDKTRPENIAYNAYIAETLCSRELFLGKDVILSARSLSAGEQGFVDR